MSNIELGKEEIGLGLAYKIASVLGISLRELTGRAEDNIKEEYPPLVLSIIWDFVISPRSPMRQNKQYLFADKPPGQGWL